MYINAGSGVQNDMPSHMWLYSDRRLMCFAGNIRIMAGNSGDGESVKSNPWMTALQVE